jgi:ATP-dependent RNA helicase RhlE
VLVFCRTKHGANRLTQQLERSGINAMAIHGNKSQNARVKALQDFKENRITALVATEVAARGLDIKELPHVVNYELPNVPEDYVHRIGRTARAGSTGSAVSLVSPDEISYLRDIEKLLKRKIDVVEPPKYEIKEGTHTPRSEANGETREYQPHQDPRRRPEHRRSGGGGGGRGRPNHSGGGRHGGGQRGGSPGAGRADHSAYMQGSDAPRSDAPRADAPRSDAHPGARSHGGGHHGGGHRSGGHGGQRAGGHGGGGRRGGQGGPGRGNTGGNRGGFARGARSGGSRSGGGDSGSGSGGGFSRIT